MDRRSFLTAAIAAAVPSLATTLVIDRNRVSAISDEVARSPTDAIEYAHKFGLQFLSLRDVPAPLTAKKYSYHSMEPDMLRQAVKEFKDADIRIGFLDTPFLKFGLPGTEPKRSRPEEAAKKESRLAREKTMFDNRLADLRLG